MQFSFLKMKYNIHYEITKPKKGKREKLEKSLNIKPAVSYLFFGLLGDDSEPVSYHAEDGSKVGESHQNPEPNNWFIVI